MRGLRNWSCGNYKREWTWWLWNEIHFAAATFFIFVIFTNKNQGKTRGKNHTETLCTCRQAHKWRRERWRKRNSCQNNNEIKSNLGGPIRVFTDKKYVYIDMFALSWCNLRIFLIFCQHFFFILKWINQLHFVKKITPKNGEIFL